jgi:type 1 fimbria pilin
LKRLAVSIAALVALGALVFAGVSSAAGSWTPISGTVYSDGTWFTSTNVRTVHSGNTSIQVQFNTLPNGNLAFYAKNYNTGIRIGSIVYAPPTSTQVLGTTASGTDFVNVFKEQNTCSLCGWNYNFSGSEYY